MYISRRNDGWKKAAVIIGIVGIVLTLTLCFFLFMKIKDLEVEVQKLTSLKTEYQELSENLDTCIKKMEEYRAELEAYYEEIETYSVPVDIEPLPEIPVESSAAVATGEDKDKDSIATKPVDIGNTEGKGKKVYLTFDDGPSSNTDAILDILKSYDCKATFFVNGKAESIYADYYRRIVDEGHTLAMHSYTHVYSDIYSSVDPFMADTVMLRDYIYRLTGIKADIYRFPGGSSNTVSEIDILEFARALDKAGIVYFDWNVSSGDAASVLRTSDEIFSNVISGIKSKNTPVVLMHDLQSKGTTVEALPEILEYLVENGYEVVALDSSVEPVQHVRLDK